MNTWVDYLVHVVAVFGAAYVFGHSKISLIPRALIWSKVPSGQFLVQLLECPACFSVHAGWVLTVIGRSLFAQSLWGAACASCFYAGSSYLLARLTGLTTVTHVHDD